MSDIFNRVPLQYKGSFAADAASMGFVTNDPAFSSVTGGGLVTQSLQISYQQPITRLYEVGTQYTYYIAGRPQGSINMARVLGPGVVSSAFYETFGDVCLADQNHLLFGIATGCKPGGGPNSDTMIFLANNVLLQSVGISVAAQDMIMNEQLSMMFTALEAGNTANSIADFLSIFEADIAQGESTDVAFADAL